MAKVRAGDRSAFEDLLRPHEGRLYRAVLRITGSPAEAADEIPDEVRLRVRRALRERAAASPAEPASEA